MTDGWYYGDDDWSVWLRFETWVWAVLLLVQLSMVAFLVIHGRKDKSFRQAFYVFFVVVTIVDCALAFLRTSPSLNQTIFGIKYDEPFTVQEDTRTHEKRFLPTIRATVNEITKHVIVPALGHAQPLFLTAIAVTRFTAFAFPLKHASLWRPRTVVLTTALLASASVILGVAYPIVATIRQAVECSRMTWKQWERLRCDRDAWAFERTHVPTALIALTSAISCIVSFVLNVGSIAMLVVLRTTGRLQRKGPELQLFVHSLWMFLLQLLLAFQDVVRVMDHPRAIINELGLDHHALIWNYFRHSSEWLAGVAGTRDWVDETWDGEFRYLEFFPGCTAPRLWGGGNTTETCSTWYLLLIGELRLREDPDFTVRTLELCLYALSGSVFLLIISGNVRDAYLKFDFEWQCLKKICGQHRSVESIALAGGRTPIRSITAASLSMPSRS